MAAPAHRAPATRPHQLLAAAAPGADDIAQAELAADAAAAAAREAELREAVGRVRPEWSRARVPGDTVVMHASSALWSLR